MIKGVKNSPQAEAIKIIDVNFGVTGITSLQKVIMDGKIDDVPEPSTKLPTQSAQTFLFPKHPKIIFANKTKTRLNDIIC